jgi:hypothetical protein
VSRASLNKALELTNRMSKSFAITSAAETRTHIERLAASAEHALTQIAALDRTKGALGALFNLKFQPVGCDPLSTDRPLNLIEQLNQTFTYLASFKATELLFELHPDCAPFTVNRGTASGHDIQAGSPLHLTAEVFAAVNTSNNDKLKKDLKKLASSPAALRYVFFMCPGIAFGQQSQLENGNGGKVWSLGGEL